MEQNDVELVQTAPAYHLQAILKGRLAGTIKAAASDALPIEPVAIAHTLLAQANLVRVMEGIDELAARVLRELVACGGRANSRDLALYFSNGDLLLTSKSESPTGQEPTSLFKNTLGTPPQYPVAHPHGVFEQALRHLLLQGLLYWGKQTNFVGRDYASGIHDGVLIVPEAVKSVVRDLWRDEEPFRSVLIDYEQAEAGEDVGDGIRRLQRMLYLYWSLVASLREGLQQLSSGLLARAALRQVMEHMGQTGHVRQQGQRILGETVRQESDVPNLLFLRLLLLKLDLLQERQGAVYARNAEAFFSLPLVERARRCYQLWQDTPFWDEMLYLPDVTVRPGPSPLEPAHEEVVHARTIMVERVEHEQVDEWRDLVTFIARTKLYAPYLLFPRHYGPRSERYMSGSNPYGWDFRLRRGWLTHREGWHMVEGGFIRTVVTGPLHWLGIVEVDDEAAPTAFRLVPGSLFLLGDVASKSQEIPTGRLIVQPNFELVALAPTSEALLVKLDRFAERVGLEHIAQYRITKASIMRAIQTGLHAEDIKTMLTQAAGGDIPQNVQYSLAEWERQARRIEMWRGVTLLEVDTPALLDELLANELTRPLLGRRLASCLAEVAPQQLATLQAFLWQRDYLPSVVVAPTENTVQDNGQLMLREPQWQLHDDGLLQPFYGVTDLYLMAEIERFSDRDQSTGWRRITVAAIQHARKAGISLDTITHFLRQYCDGGIPPSFLIRLRLWGEGYARHTTVAVEQTPMVRLSAQVLQDLRADADFSPLLGDELEQESRLVRIHAEDVARVVELLQERGFTVNGA